VNWDLVIAGAGLFIGLFNVVAWWIERRDRKAEVAEERRIRNEQHEIEKQRFQVEQEDREKQLHAEVTVEQAGFNRSPGAGEYYFLVKNLGPSWAKHISIHLRNIDEDPLTTEAIVGYLERGEEERATLLVPERLWQELTPVWVWVKWSDDRGGPHEQRANLHVRLN
jgi:hypothetical protein